jgi:hypothetical protein
MVFAPTIARGIPCWFPLLAGIAWAIAAYLLLKRVSSTVGWRDIHRWALIFGALLVSMTAGFLGSSTWPRMDVVAKAILNVLAVLSLVALARSISRRDPALSEERTRSRHQSLIASLHTRGAAPFASFTTTPSHVIFTKVLPEWRNWQTQQTQSQRCSIAQNYSPIYKRKRGLSCGLNKKAQVFSRLLIPTHGVVTDKLKTKAGRRAVQGRTTSLTHKAEVSRHASSA